jgi:hypothetical protein
MYMYGTHAQPKAGDIVKRGWAVMVKAAAQKTPCPVGKDTYERQMQYNMQHTFSASLWACRSVCVKSKVITLLFTHTVWAPGGSPLQGNLVETHFDLLGVTIFAESGMGPNAGISHKNMWAAWALLQRQYHTMMVSFSESPESASDHHDVCVPSIAFYGCEV